MFPLCQADDKFAFKPLNATDNNGLTSIVETLEMVYTTVGGMTRYYLQYPPHTSR